MLSALVSLLGAAVLFLGWSQYKTMCQYHTSLVVAVVGWAVLIAMVIPQQKTTIGGGVFNLMWIILLILMYI
ncbi:hypothetical protein [Corynebacterium cystitidis]|uniref:Uncharacterized protein n=1 Tax=Corynebacterium cystitidis DSM 20524 TaxID=1121357 RepID=A0A1H9RYQ1_9CORY|nr:hypothetical protein [Corynebacterium cystitidis]WJY82142.1 hypothetical protein CCYS_06040 [Corynebacterium cystitidis DSM 20524]SER77881.1 hypothetical protein SAMN05661109_00983 [Corynebacterium cystitidis DSM 20524]SNV78681.1 hypothetical membrane protein [Corynebacterium cystitidis]